MGSVEDNRTTNLIERRSFLPGSRWTLYGNVHVIRTFVFDRWCLSMFV